MMNKTTNKDLDEKENNNKPFNVILLGNIQSDKEALIHKLIKKRFAINQIKKLNKSIDNKDNIDETLNSMEIHGETVKIKIWDNTSANKIFSYSNKTLKSVQGMILFYSVCDRNSFNMLKSNLHKIMDMKNYDFPMVMVGNDSDSPKREVNYEEAKALADSYGLSFYEVSINTGMGIQPMFEDLGEQVVYREYQEGQGGDLWKSNNKSMILNRNNNDLMSYRSQKNRNKNISIYANNEMFEDEFNKSLKSKKLKNLNGYTLSNNKKKQRTNYKTGNTESNSDIDIEDSMNKTLHNKTKSKNSFLLKSPDILISSTILPTSPPVVFNYQGTTAAQKKREEEIRLKRLKREKEMKSWWKQREKENLETQKMKKKKEKK